MTDFIPAVVLDRPRIGRRFTSEDWRKWCEENPEKCGGEKKAAGQGAAGTLSEGTTLYHTTRQYRVGQIRQSGIAPSSNGESGPGVYFARDPEYAAQIRTYDPTMKTIEFQTTNDLQILNRDTANGEKIFRDSQRDPVTGHLDPAAQVGKLAALGYDGVSHTSPGQKYPEVVIHDPANVTITPPSPAAVVASPGALDDGVFADDDVEPLARAMTRANASLAAQAAKRLRIGAKLGPSGTGFATHRLVTGAEWRTALEEAGVADQIADLVVDGFIAVRIGTGVAASDKATRAAIDTAIAAVTSYGDGLAARLSQWASDGLAKGVTLNELAAALDRGEALVASGVVTSRQILSAEKTHLARFASQPLTDQGARNAARSQASAAANAGSVAGMLDTEVPNKVWITMDDERVRESHANLDGVSIPTTDPFNVGGSDGMYPGDPDLPDEEVMGCRCYVMPADEHPLTFDTLDAVVTAADEIANSLGGPFEAKVSGYGVLGSEEPPATVLYLQADKLAAAYDLAWSEPYDYGSESFPPRFPTFIPHLTLGYGVPLELAAGFHGKTILLSRVVLAVDEDWSVQELQMQGAVQALDATPMDSATPEATPVEAGPTHAGLLIQALDSGRVLLVQRRMDPADPAAGTWEAPGGSIEPGEQPVDAARREWTEEVGHVAPEGEPVGSWASDDGVYEGFLVEVPSEAELDINLGGEGRALNPDDPDQDDVEVACWWEPTDLPEMPALREEMQNCQAMWDLILPADQTGDEMTATSTQPRRGRFTSEDWRKWCEANPEKCGGAPKGGTPKNAPQAPKAAPKGGSRPTLARPAGQPSGMPVTHDVAPYPDLGPKPTNAEMDAAIFPTEWQDNRSVYGPSPDRSTGRPYYAKATDTRYGSVRTYIDPSPKEGVPPVPWHAEVQTRNPQGGTSGGRFEGSANFKTADEAMSWVDRKLGSVSGLQRTSPTGVPQ